MFCLQAGRTLREELRRAALAHLLRSPVPGEGTGVIRASVRRVGETRRVVGRFKARVSARVVRVDEGRLRGCSQSRVSLRHQDTRVRFLLFLLGHFIYVCGGNVTDRLT